MSKIFNYILLIGIIFASGFKFAEYVDSEQLNLLSLGDSLFFFLWGVMWIVIMEDSNTTKTT